MIKRFFITVSAILIRVVALAARSPSRRVQPILRTLGLSQRVIPQTVIEKTIAREIGGRKSFPHRFWELRQRGPPPRVSDLAARKVSVINWVSR